MPGGGGGGGGGDTNTMQTTNSTNTTGPNPAIAPRLQTLVGGAWDHMQPNWKAPGYFPTGTVAPQSERTGIANTALWQLGSNNLSSPLRGAGQQQLMDTIGGKYLEADSNPAFQGWLEASFRPQAEQFRDILAPSIDGKFSGSGRTAGGAHFDTTMRGVNDLNRSQSDAAAKAALSLYQGERGNQFAALNLMPSFQAMDYADVGAMQQSGQNVDAYNQRLLDDQNAKYGYDQTKQLDWYNRLSQTLQSMYPGGTTQGQSQGTGQGTAGGGGGGGGQGMQLAGAGIAAAGTIAAAFI